MKADPVYRLYQINTSTGCILWLIDLILFQNVTPLL